MGFLKGSARLGWGLFVCWDLFKGARRVAPWGYGEKVDLKFFQNRFTFTRYRGKMKPPSRYKSSSSGKGNIPPSKPLDNSPKIAYTCPIKGVDGEE